MSRGSLSTTTTLFAGNSFLSERLQLYNWDFKVDDSESRISGIGSLLLPLLLMHELKDIGHL